MKLTSEEKEILNGKQGPVMQRIMETLVSYGDILNADRLLDIEGNGHFSISGSTPGVDAPVELLEELVEAGLTTKFPFTLDPREPLDFRNLGITPEQELEFKRMFKDNGRAQTSMKKLGLQNHDAYTCSPYVFEEGNIPKRGDVLAWSESSCVVYANSALGARTNRNAAILDLLSNIAGKTPEFGLLTEEGRKANWKVEVRTEKLPNPQLLGAAIGNKVQDGIPYISGLRKFLGDGISESTRDYLKEMGAACAAIGAVALYHIEWITPEAIDFQNDLLQGDHKTYQITDEILAQLIASYPVMWKDPNALPQKAMIGCPHLSLRELHEWTDRITTSLQAHNRDKLAVETILVAPPKVLRHFRHDTPEAFERLSATGARLSGTCLESYMNNSLCGNEAVLTNSNKLRTFTNARLILDAQLAEIIATGKIPINETVPPKVDVQASVASSRESSAGTRSSKTQREFEGRPLFRGNVRAKALVSHTGFNSLASFYNTVLGNDDQAICGDHDAPELYGKNLTGSALCIPTAIGSTSAGAVWELVARRNVAPAVILLSSKIDSLSAAGLILAEKWANNRIYAVDSLGEDFINTVAEGDMISVEEDGTVTIESR